MIHWFLMISLPPTSNTKRIHPSAAFFRGPPCQLRARGRGATTAKVAKESVTEALVFVIPAEMGFTGNVL